MDMHTISEQLFAVLYPDTKAFVEYSNDDTYKFVARVPNADMYWTERRKDAMDMVSETYGLNVSNTSYYGEDGDLVDLTFELPN